MLLNETGHDLTIGRQGANRRLFILTHEATVTLDISTEDGRELALHTGLRIHQVRPLRSVHIILAIRRFSTCATLLVSFFIVRIILPAVCYCQTVYGMRANVLPSRAAAQMGPFMFPEIRKRAAVTCTG